MNENQVSARAHTQHEHNYENICMTKLKYDKINSDIKLGQSVSSDIFDIF